MDDGNVTKIELELEEAPDGKEDRHPAILVGSMSSELDSTAEINSTYPGPGYPRPSGVVVVRAEEALIVVFVLLLWVGAIALFFNRWGKIRMLEPYQPKFQQHRNSCTSIDPPPLEQSSCGFNHPNVNPIPMQIHLLFRQRYTAPADPQNPKEIRKYPTVHISMTV
ncbi:hypothetical protein G9C98_005985 [Cotesia typhae]|uniref:Fibronectin type III domain-containing protein n=1 Tax=Cotesia typhae TaxID=2053667 RepID=A0A8J5V8A1_9HYME|nr:hypothetical protein G9C98_005985 [Cotesia typhae]